MPHFTDSTGEKWLVDITIGTVKRIKKLLKADFGNPLLGEPAPLTRFHLDIAFICDVLFVVCQHEAKEREVSDLDFADRLSGDASYAAYIAFLEALADFFQQLHRPDVVTAIQRMREKVTQQVEAATKAINSPEFDKQVNDAISGRLSTNTPESSESTPPPSPGES